MKKVVYQLKIELAESKPRIWREFQVDSKVTFHQLHQLIQKVMGWKDYHLFQFVIGNHTVEDDRLGDMDMDFGDLFDIERPPSSQAKKTKLIDLVSKPKEKFQYIYDMGDDWTHTLTLKKIIELESEAVIQPVVLGGERKCPPEDVGGIWGYQSMLEIIEDPEDPDYQDVKRILGKKFDPASFDLEALNRKFKKQKAEVSAT